MILRTDSKSFRAVRYSSVVWIVLGILIFPFLAHGQKGSSTRPGYAVEKWKVADPFEQKVFIENDEGQFDGKTGKASESILYGTVIGGTQVYFTQTGLVYRRETYPEMKQGEAEDEKDKRDINPEVSLFREEWKGANANATIVPEDEVSFYYCYPKSCKHTTIAHAFNRILYKNIYPHIDIEYSFKKDRKGIEYKLIVHPGGDLTQVKEVYPDALSENKNRKGGIELNSPIGIFTEEAPEKAYYLENNKAVSVKNIVEGNEESFSAGKYDQSKTLVIDPFKTNPLMTGYNAGYDVCYDLNGNVYAYGSFSWFQEVKINAAGSIQWLFNAVFPATWGGVQYGDFAVDENCGTSYLSSSGYGMMLKVNTLGIQVDSFDFSSQMNELWRMYYNHCISKLVLGGGGTALNYQLCTLDTTMTNFNPINTLNTAGGHRDISLLTVNNINDYVYCLVANPVVGGVWNNQIIKTPYPALQPFTDTAKGNFTFTEACCDANYIDGVGGHSLAMNGMVTSPNWVYGYDGQTLRRYSKNTLANITSWVLGSAKYSWGGIDADQCDNIYITVDTLINVYDSALNQTGTIHPGYQVYDLHIMPNNQLCCAGKGFVSDFAITTNIMRIKKTRKPAACGQNNGWASAKLTGCGNDSSQYNYLWSNGATTQLDTGLAPGTYTITISSNCDFKFIDTVLIPGGNNGGMNLTFTQTNVKCYGDSNGKAKVNVVGGNAPYTYDWQPGGGSADSITGLKVGTYTVTVSDSTGCNTAVVTITQPAKLTVVIDSSVNPGCINHHSGSIAITAAGGTPGYFYLWTPPGRTSDTLTHLAAGIYTLTVTDANGCGLTLTDTLKQPTVPVPAITGNHPICDGASITVTASGGTGYLWNTGATTSSITVSPNTNTTYQVHISNGPCSADTSFNVIVWPVPAVTLAATTVSMCQGDTSVITATGGGTYLWSPGGSTNSTISVYPASTTTYSVQVSNGNCTKDTTITISVNRKPNAVVSSNQSICAGASTTLTVSGAQTYKWIPSAGLNCDTCSTVTASPSVTTVYTIVAANGGCTDTVHSSVTVFSASAVTACCNDTIQMGDTANLHVIGGGIKNYLWTPLTKCDTCANTKVWPLFSTTYFVQVNDSNGCARMDSVRIFVEGCSNAWIPNAFTPDGDGVNDVFGPKGVCIVSYTIRIFDRWGEMLYHNDESQPWNGVFKGQVVQEDVYVYQIIVLDGFLKRKTYIGRVTVIK